MHLPSVRQVLGGGAAPGDAPRGRYVVCGDRVPQKEEDMRVFNGLQGTWLFGLQGRNRERLSPSLKFFLVPNNLEKIKEGNHTYKLIKK